MIGCGAKGRPGLDLAQDGGSPEDGATQETQGSWAGR